MAENSDRTAKTRRGRPFARGRSGNPGGRPRVPEEVVEAARACTMRAIEVLAGLMESADSDSVRVRAAEALLNRAWGTPAHADADAVPVKVAVNLVWSDSPAMTATDAPGENRIDGF